MPPPAATPLNAHQLSLFDRLEALFPRRAEPEPPLRSLSSRSAPQAPGPTSALERFAAPTAASPVGAPVHQVRLGDAVVDYRLRRARRRSIGFVIGLDGLTVSAPRWVGHVDIERALHTKAAWILRKLVEQRERARRTEAARIQWADGVSLPYLGEPLQIVLDPLMAGAMLETAAGDTPGRRLRVGLPLQASADQIRDRVLSWLQRQARQLFQERCEHFAPSLGVRMTRLRLSSAQTRWGSASADGSIRLNWRLVHFSLAVIDYVVAHELAHLREMNHSPAFWQVVRSVIPDLDQRKAQLRAPGLPLWD